MAAEADSLAVPLAAALQHQLVDPLRTRFADAAQRDANLARTQLAMEQRLMALERRLMHVMIVATVGTVVAIAVALKLWFGH